MDRSADASNLAVKLAQGVVEIDRPGIVDDMSDRVLDLNGTIRLADGRRVGAYLLEEQLRQTKVPLC